MSVTPSLTGKSTSFITFAAVDRNMLWFTDQNSQDGIYTITITGSINITSTPWTRSISFVLTVSGTCDYSTGYLIFAPINSTNCTNST